MYAAYGKHTERAAERLLQARKAALKPKTELALTQQQVEEAEREAEELMRLAERRKKAMDTILIANRMLAGRRDGGIPLARIVRRICRALKVTQTELLSYQKSPTITLARQAVMYWACRLTTLSLPQIGHSIGRDHGTVVHGRRAYVEKRAAMGRTLRAAR